MGAHAVAQAGEFELLVRRMHVVIIQSKPTSSESIPSSSLIDPTAGMLPPVPMSRASLSNTSVSAPRAATSHLGSVGTAIAGL